jgi:hypothetical protein
MSMQLVATASTTSSSPNVVGPLNVQVGDLMVFVSSYGNIGQLAGITDNSPNGNMYFYLSAANLSQGAPPAGIAIAVWAGVIESPGNLSWTVEVGLSTLFQHTVVMQYRGIANVIDQFNGSSVASGATNYTTNSITTTSPQELIVAGFYQLTAQQFTLTGNMTEIAAIPATPDTIVLQQIVYNTGTYSGSGTVQTPDGYLGVIVSLVAPVVLDAGQPDTDFVWGGGDPW